MEELFIEYQTKLAKLNRSFRRYLFDRIDLANRLIAIKGARGVGKTTLLLQLAKAKMPKETSLYVSLDHVYFYENRLYELARHFAGQGGTHLLLDEVHKYPHWSREIKLIYDNYPELSLIVTSSSALELYRSEADLSRRMITYELAELSFREFIRFETGSDLPAFSLQEMLSRHEDNAADIIQRIRPLPLFQKYLKMGAYPYYKENESAYFQKLSNTINLTIEIDLLAIENLRFETTIKLKKLLSTIAGSVPFTPNVSKLSEYTGLSRNQLVEAIKVLNRAGLLTELYKNTSGIGLLTKPEKLYLNNTNLMQVLSSQPVNSGTLRETFFVHQLRSSSRALTLAEKGDFWVDGLYLVEIGGKNKTRKQLRENPEGFIVKDNLEIGAGKTIPLWLFGFLY